MAVRPAYVGMRAALTAAGAVGGFAAADALLRRDVLTGHNNLLYLTLLGLLVGYLVSAPVARRWARLWSRVLDSATAVPPDVVLAGGTGATVALLITVLLNNVLAAVPGFTWFWSLLIASVLVTASTWFFVTNRRLFAPLRMTSETVAPPQREVREKVIDTSAIIDGRIVEVLQTNFLDSPLLVPRFVLIELQRVADSSDPLRRRRGRRGLEVLDRLTQLPGTTVEVVTDDPADVEEVDEKLLRLCLQRSADLITTDYNLDRIAGLQGVRVLNVNALANAVKATFLPGERLSLSVVKEGREPDQGLAYLEDGTMVVIEDAAHLVGRTIDAVVTSSLQTNMGRMIFARPDDGS